MRSASIRHCWTSPGTIATNRGRWRWPAATKKAASNEPSDTCEMRSLPPAASPTSTISMRRPKLWCNGQAADRRCPGRAGTHACARCSPTKRRLLPLPDNPRAAAGARRGQGRQDALCPLRPERLHGPAYPCAAHADGAGRSARGAHRRWRACARPPSAQLRQGRADRGPGSYPGAGRAASMPPASIAPPIASPGGARRPRTC